MTVFYDHNDDSDTNEGYYERVPKNQSIFDEEFGLIRQKRRKTSMAVKNKLDNCGRKNRINSNLILDFIPILKWLPKYNIKENLMNDIIGGLTVGIMHVPQGMAYSSLAGVKPVNGLYTSLFPAIFYMIFGTSRHVSLGVFAVVSLLVGSCNLRVTEIIYRKITPENSTLLIHDMDEDAHMAISISVITSLALLVGIIQVSMAILRADFLIAFLSDQVIAGFTTGAAIHVLTAQLNKILGISLPRHSGIGKLFFIYKDLINNVIAGAVNPVTLSLSFVTIILLYSLKNYVDPHIKKKCKLPIPYDLFVMIIGTIISAIFNLNENYNVKIIGAIPTGIPLPKIPDIYLFHYFMRDALAISIVSLVVTISMGKLFAKKHSYEIDIRQEFYAMGFTELLSSMFPVWPSSTALARTLVYEAAGTKTQLATIFSSLLLLSVVYFIGPFVEVLPTCFLSCIIIVALKGMFMQLSCMPVLWSISKGDYLIFLISFLATVTYDVVEGLMIGMLFALCVVIYNIQSAKIVEIGRLSHNEGQAYFQPVEKYRDATVREGVCCVRFSAPLIYLNAERFKKSIEEVIKLPISAKKRREEDSEKEKSLKLSRNSTGSTLKSTVVTHESTIQTKFPTAQSKNPPTAIRALVVDMSSVPSVDYTGANCLIDMFNEQKKNGVSLYFAAVPLAILTTLETIPEVKNIGMTASFYPSVEDALDNVDITSQ